MSNVVSYFEHKRRTGSGRVRHIDPAVVEIIEALLVLGGRAHRQAVADQVLLRRRGRACPADFAARNEIYAGFDAYLTWAASRRAPPLLHRPLGAESYRWALTDAGVNLFQPSTPAERIVH